MEDTEVLRRRVPFLGSGQPRTLVMKSEGCNERVTSENFILYGRNQIIEVLHMKGNVKMYGDYMENMHKTAKFRSLEGDLVMGAENGSDKI